MKRPKILILAPDLPYPIKAGGQMRMASMISALGRFADLRIVCIAPEIPPETGEWVSDLGGSIINFPRQPVTGIKLWCTRLKAILAGSNLVFYPEEKEYMERLYNSGKMICALAKSSNVMIYGKNMRGVMTGVIKGRGFCLLENTAKYKMYSVRLSDKGDVFRFDIHRGDLFKVLGIIARNSKDLVFPGYPYGLILVDRFARVQNHEREYYLTILKTKLGRRWEKIRPFLDISHEVLDNIS